MPRPPKKRRICRKPCCEVFKPAGTPVRKSELIQLGLDEYEALRLVDLEGLYQEQAAEQMKTSRATLGRIVEDARRKMVRALVEARPLQIAGGNVDICGRRAVRCTGCGELSDLCQDEAPRITCTICGETLDPVVCVPCDEECVRQPK